MKSLLKKLRIAYLLFALVVGLSSNSSNAQTAIEKARDDEVSQTKHNITSTLVDDRNNKLIFSNTQTNSSFIADDFDKTVITIVKEGIFYLCDFTKVEHLERLSAEKVAIYLKNDKQLTGNWVCNDRTSNFYQDQNNPLETGYIYGFCNGLPSKIRINRIKKLIIDQVNDTTQQKTKKSTKLPKRIELTNGLSFSTDYGYLVDFCGHWWSSTYHTRLDDKCRTMKNGSISLNDIAEIEFTSKREIILTYKGGKKITDYLFLTSESYSGVCNHSGRFSSFDKMYLRQDFGVILVPLDMVKKIIPNPPVTTLKETTEEDKKMSERTQKPELPFCKGVNYVSWTTGDYPFTSAWHKQTYYDSQAIIEAKITTNKPFLVKDDGSLELTLDIQGESKTHRNGEVFVDLRYTPCYEAMYPINVKRSPDGKLIGVDLSNKTLAAVVFCQKGTAGSLSAPNGLQLFLKSVEIKNGQEVWSSYYGNWHNIWTGQRDWSARLELGDIRENEWSLVSLRVPDLTNGPIKPPIYGYTDPGFNPKNVALIGLKYGLNDNARQNNFSGKIWVDDFGWKDIVSEGDATFEFYKVPHPYDVKIWEYFGKGNVSPLPFEEGIVFKKSCLFKSVGNSVYFNFQQTQNPIASLRENNFNIVAIVNTEYMDDKHSITIAPYQGKSHTFEEIAALIDAVHANNMRVLLKPHVDVKDDSWRGEIDPFGKTPWFKSYTDFIVRYAKLAEKHHVEILAIGTEFKSYNGNDNRAYWEEVVKSIRQVYSGTLTYAANWDDYENVCLWDLVDVVGIDAYFPISAKQNPTLAELTQGWSNTIWNNKQRNWVAELDRWQKIIDKDIIFTEVGYRSTDYAAREPWEYKEDRPLNLELQANCYQALLDAFKDKLWFKGVFFWNWSPKQDDGGKFNTDFTPQNKPAERVFRRSDNPNK